MRPCGIGLRRTFAHNRPSNGRSAAYFVCPVTLPYPSMRGNAFPTVRNAKVHLQHSKFEARNPKFETISNDQIYKFQTNFLRIPFFRFSRFEILFLSEFVSNFDIRISDLLFNHLIRPLEHADWNCQTDLFCRLETDHKLELRRLLHRQISRFGTFQYLVHVNSRAPIQV